MHMDFNLEQYLSKGVENIIKGALRGTLHNPREAAFLLGFQKEAKKARDLRRLAEEQGKHIPPFLIASITNQCNLHCKGCYARANHACHDMAAKDQMSADEWDNVFAQAGDLGVSFILLAGGEPMVRYDVLQRGASYKEIIFPVFTNGTMFSPQYIELFHKNRNLFPVLSIEGNQMTTDARRGPGMNERLCQGMEKLKENKIMFGASVTVTKANRDEVTRAEFVDLLYKQGCRVIVYVEYVPINQESEGLALDDKDRIIMTQQLMDLRGQKDEMLFISFPGDEKSSGGCLAAGRGFFHINYHGGAEPCPFSPYSDTNVREVPLSAALESPFFAGLQQGGFLQESHEGGCVLFAKRKEVEELLGGE